MNNLPTREEILKESLYTREHEIMMYQINIDNYRIAIEIIDSLDPVEQFELKDFKEQLIERYGTEVHEQKKAKIMLDVLKQQITT